MVKFQIMCGVKCDEVDHNDYYLTSVLYLGTFVKRIILNTYCTEVQISPHTEVSILPTTVLLPMQLCTVS